MIYPIRTPKSLPDYHYEGRFSEGVSKIGKSGEMALKRDFLRIFSEKSLIFLIDEDPVKFLNNSRTMFSIGY